MKTSLFSSPHGKSDHNFALDAQREMDHRDAVKGFRPRATVSSVLPRLSLVDKLNEVHESRIFPSGPEDESSTPLINRDVTDRDFKFAIPAATLILRQNALSLKPDSVPKNVYTKSASDLADSVLDKNTYDVGRYLIMRFACNSGLCDMSPADCPDVNEIQGPKPLIAKIRKGTSVTVKRVSVKISLRECLTETARNRRDKKLLQRKIK